jgi:hypothetical protein
MQKTALLLISLALANTCRSASAQMQLDPETFYNRPDSVSGKTVVLPIDTYFEGRVDQTIGSSISKPGTRFTVTLAAPVLANGSEVLIPAGSQILGEVVEAIPSSRLPKDRGAPKPTGKLRVQLNGLKTPDGMSYPLVASITGEKIVQSAYSQRANPLFNNANIGYVGAQANFSAVGPNMQNKGMPVYGAPRVVSRNDMQRDPIFGRDYATQVNLNQSGHEQIRSLVKRDHNLFIFAGSPITMKLDAPFKMGISAAPGETQTFAPTYGKFDPNSATIGRRFTPINEAPKQTAPPPDQGPLPMGGGPPQNQGNSLVPQAKPPNQQQQQDSLFPPPAAPPAQQPGSAF